MLGWIAIIIGILVLLGICWYHRKTIKSFFKANKKKIGAVAVAGGMLGTGGMAVISDTDFIIPEGYRPNTATMITNSNGKYWAATGANIQLAIDDLTSSGEVNLPSGTITNTVDITLDENITLIGTGISTILNFTDSCLLVYDTSNVTLKDFKYESNEGIYIWNENKDVYNIVLENIVAKVTNYSGGITDGAFIVFPKNDKLVEDIKFINCKASNSDCIGFMFNGAGTTDKINKVLLENCEASRCGLQSDRKNEWVVGFDLAESVSYVENMTVTNCIANNNYESGFHFEETPRKKNIIISDCIASYNGVDKVAPTFGSGFLIGNNVTISNCIVVGNELRGIKIKNGAKVSNCLIDGEGVTDDGIRADDATSSPYYITTIVDNIITGVVDEGIEFVKCTKIICSGNYIENVGEYGISVESSGVKSKHCIVSNNVIDNVVSYHGISVKSSTMVLGNIINNTGSDGISTSSAAEHSVFTGNIISNTSGKGIKVSADNCIITTNTLVDITSTVISNTGSGNIINNNIGYDYDSLQDDYVWNSNGKYWAVGSDETNLQAAIDDCGSSGWVELPECNITITAPVEIGSYIHLFGQGNNSILYLEDGANCSVIRNKNWDHYPSLVDTVGIELSDFVIDGNQYGQDQWVDAGNHANNQMGVNFVNCNSTTIRNVVVRETLFHGFFLADCRDVRIDGVRCYNLGLRFSGVYGAAWEAIVTGIFFASGDNHTVVNSVFDSCYGGGIRAEVSGVLEGGCANFIWDSNTASNCWFGFRTEGRYTEATGEIKVVQDGIISNNMIINATRSDAYQQADVGEMQGIGINRATFNVTISGNVIDRAGNLTTDEGYGIKSTGKNIIIDSNAIHEIYGVGISIRNADHTVSNNVIDGTTSYGIHVRSSNAYDADDYDISPIITGNRITNTLDSGIYLKENSVGLNEINRGGIISGNRINATELNSGYGIENYLWNIIISDNVIDGYLEGIRLYSAQHVTIHGNNIYSDDYGINLYGTSSEMVGNCSIGFNDISVSGGGTGLRVRYAHMNSVMANIIHDCTTGIDEVDNSDSNIYLGNIVDCTTDYDINGDNCLPAVGDRGNFNIGTFT